MAFPAKMNQLAAETNKKLNTDLLLVLRRANLQFVYKITYCRACAWASGCMCIAFSPSASASKSILHTFERNTHIARLTHVKVS